MEWAKERRGTRRGDAPPGRRYESMASYMFIVLNVFLPIYLLERGLLEILVFVCPNKPSACPANFGEFGARQIDQRLHRKADIQPALSP
jgi:hypothetical protein